MKFASTPTSPTSDTSGVISAISSPATSTIPADDRPGDQPPRRSRAARAAPGAARTARRRAGRPARSAPASAAARGGGGAAAAGWEYSGGRGGGSGCAPPAAAGPPAGGGGIGSAGTCSAGASYADSPLGAAGPDSRGSRRRRRRPDAAAAARHRRSGGGAAPSAAAAAAARARAGGRLGAGARPHRAVRVDVELVLAGPAGRAEAGAGADARRRSWGRRSCRSRGSRLPPHGANGYHLRPMDARAWMVRLAVGAGLAGGFAALAQAQTPTPTPSPAPPQLSGTGAPKILLAFDASGSMLTDDGNGTPQDRRGQGGGGRAAGARCRTRRSSGCGSTAARCRAARSTRRARTRASCSRSAGSSQGGAEEKIRSFKARGRTPIAYALAGGREGPRRQRLAHDRARLRRQGHLPAAVAVRGRARGLQGRRDPAHPGDRVQRRQGGAGRAASASPTRAAACTARRPTPRRCAQELRVLSTRTLRQYVARGKPIKGGPSARQATPITPGRYIDKVLPDEERWYAIDLARGETLKASASFIPPDREAADRTLGADSSLDIVTPGLRHPGHPELERRAARRSSAAATSTGSGVVSRPIGVGEQADADAAVLQARPLLPQARARGLLRQGALQRHGRQAVRRRALDRGARAARAASRRRSPSPKATPQPLDTPNEPPEPGRADAGRRRARRARASRAPGVLTLPRGGGR